MELFDNPRTTLAFEAADTTKSFTITANKRGTSLKTLIEIPNFTNAVTLAFQIAEAGGNILYSIAALAKNQVNPTPAIVTAAFPVYQGCVITLTLSGAPGGSGGTAAVTIYFN